MDEAAFVYNEPELIRADFSTVLSQYRGNNCVLDVYFASSVEDVLSAPVVHYEARYRDEGLGSSRAECFLSVVSNYEHAG